MRNDELEVLKRLRDDFPFYARHCLKIVDKADGQVKPFILNRAQRYIHAKIEEQKARIGKVRIVLVKGRQQGSCFSPDMRVLTADYRWVRIGDVPLGERLFAIDENLGAKNKGGRNEARRIQTTVVEAKANMMADTYRMVLDNGAELIITGAHRNLCQKRGTTDAVWRSVDDTRVGDYIRILTPPPGKEKVDFEDGWFSGLLDGEGSFGANPGLRIGISQVDGPVLDRARKYLDDNGIRYYELVDRRPATPHSKRGNKEVFCLRVDRMSDVLKLLVLTRPSRFVNRELFAGKKLPLSAKGFVAWAKVVSITPAGRREVVDLQTQHKTFICEGMVTHNSTLVAGRYFHKATLNPGSTVFILAHMADSTNHLFTMAKRYYENAPSPILPSIDKMNERRLEFNAINSSYAVGTAGSAQIGRGTTVRYFHGSECSFWENADDIAAGVLQAVPNASGTEIILESTPNGPGNWFHTKAMQGLSEESDGDFRTIFVPWYWQDEYSKTPPKDFCRSEEEDGLARSFGLTDAQLYWRRGTIADAFGGDVWRFKREYPNSVDEGFSASGEQLIAPALVIAARKCKSKDPFSPIVGGCDPARTNDRTVMILRRGREIVKCSKYNTMDEMTCAGLIAQDIDKYDVVKYFIDVGCGYGTIDRLKELGYGGIVMGVHFGATALQNDVFTNKGAEMADAVREWFEGGGANIPDTDDFQADIVAIPPLRTQGSRGRLGLPPKDEIKKVLGRSSDYFDALRLSFAYPVASRAAQNRIRRVELDTRRPNSPLSTVRDFNRTAKKSTTHTSNFMIK